MNVPDQSARELANHVAATVRKRARPWRAMIAAVLALACAVLGAHADGHQQCARLVSQASQVCKPWTWFGPGLLTYKLIAGAAAAGFCLFGVAAVVGFAGKAREALAPKAGLGHAAVVRYTILLLGSVITLAGTLALLKIPIGQLVVGGALTTILIGIAAQQSLGNVFAGLVLLFSRPFQVGDRIVVRSGSLGGPFEGTVTEIGIVYVRLDTSDGIMHLPNAQVLAAGVGHARPAPRGTAGRQASNRTQPCD
ncbi:MAG TPA: mechanosensitive ion channel domain-containing protein [Streptosporangiaceae bacterium]|nr:mechanosensitive ion channel domain-containing protein [Streptosporangiaceae bacterium]